jgi:hypothetical protein
MKRTAIIGFAFLLAAFSLVMAGDQVEKQLEKTTFEGKLVCTSCDLKQSDGARAQCSVYGHEHGLKTKDGKNITFLHNQYSDDLIKGEKYHNQDATVTGTYYADANQLDVETFTVDGKQKSWCGHCEAMDGCMAKGGM